MLFPSRQYLAVEKKYRSNLEVKDGSTFQTTRFGHQMALVIQLAKRS